MSRASNSPKFKQPESDIETEALRQELHEAVAENVRLKKMIEEFTEPKDVFCNSNTSTNKIVCCSWGQMDAVFAAATKAQFRFVTATQNGLVYTLFFERSS